MPDESLYFCCTIFVFLCQAFQGILISLCYGIINYPYFACLNAEYKMVGYIIGLVYSFVRYGRFEWRIYVIVTWSR